MNPYHDDKSPYGGIISSSVYLTSTHHGTSLLFVLLPHAVDVTSEGIWYSPDSGNNWIQANNILYPTASWKAIEVSDDGQTIVATTFNGVVISSIDGGTNWKDEGQIGANIGLSTDGTTLTVAENFLGTSGFDTRRVSHDAPPPSKAF